MIRHVLWCLFIFFEPWKLCISNYSDYYSVTVHLLQSIIFTQITYIINLHMLWVRTVANWTSIIKLIYTIDWFLFSYGRGARGNFSTYSLLKTLDLNFKPAWNWILKEANKCLIHDVRYYFKCHACSIIESQMAVKMYAKLYTKM